MGVDKKVCGFTVIEFAVVITISGIVTALLAQLVAPYMSDYRYRSTVAKMNKITSALNNYTDAVNRLPFPSDPTMVAERDPNAGCECGQPCTPVPAGATAATIVAADQATQKNCLKYLNTIPMGGCTPSGGICKVPGTHHTASNPDPDPTHMDPIYIGGIPYRSITAMINNAGVDNAALGDTLDAWDYQMSYAVSSGSTSSAWYEQGAYGVVDVKTEPKPNGTPGTDFTPPVPPSTISVGAVNYILIAAGDNHMGAYTANGTMPVPCAGPTLDVENCNKDANFISALRSVGTNDIHYFDDIVQFSSFSISMLWDFTPTAKTNPSHATDIYNLNPGNVGVGFAGTGKSPSQMLEIYDNTINNPAYPGTLAVVDPNGNGNSAIETQICDISGASNACWSPNLFAGPLPVDPATGNPNPNPSTNFCLPSTKPGFVNAVTSIAYGQVSCISIPQVTPPLNQYCPTTPSQQYITGFDPAGNIQCHTLPLP